MVRSSLAAGLIGMSAMLLTACGATASPSAQSGSPAQSASGASAPAPSQSGIANSLDPCQLVTASEASSLAGTTYGAGREETFSGSGKGCVYGYQTLNVFTVEVAQSSNAATARADFSKEQARAQEALKKLGPSGVSLHLSAGTVPNLGDRAARVTGSATLNGQTLGVSGIYVLKGTIFFAFQDVQLGSNAPSAAAMEAEARTVLSRLP
jgi:hypothetical protein